MLRFRGENPTTKSARPSAREGEEIVASLWPPPLVRSPITQLQPPQQAIRLRENVTRPRALLPLLSSFLSPFCTVNRIVIRS